MWVAPRVGGGLPSAGGRFTAAGGGLKPGVAAPGDGTITSVDVGLGSGTGWKPGFVGP
ncbi:hypothetical protein GCM10010483_69830 [Actinokineospora diospyrosa]